MRIDKDENGKEYISKWCLNPRGTKALAHGGSGGIYYWPDKPGEVIKLPWTTPSSIENVEIEKRIFKRLGCHPNIVPCLRMADTGPVSVVAEHIVLKRAEHGSIREYFREGGTATMKERVRWCKDISRAVQYVHDHGVRHGDLGGRNVLLDSSRTVLLCDFAGSGIDGQPPKIFAEEGFKHPVMEENENATIQAELHALGSTIYEIITSTTPHNQLQPWMAQWIRDRNFPGVSDDHVEGWMVDAWFQEGKYPDVAGVTLGDIITKCWKGQFQSAQEVAQSIERELGSSTPCTLKLP